MISTLTNNEIAEKVVGEHRRISMQVRHQRWDVIPDTDVLHLRKFGDERDWERYADSRPYVVEVLTRTSDHHGLITRHRLMSEDLAGAMRNYYALTSDRPARLARIRRATEAETRTFNALHLSRVENLVRDVLGQDD